MASLSKAAARKKSVKETMEDTGKTANIRTKTGTRRKSESNEKSNKIAANCSNDEFENSKHTKGRY